MRSAGVCDEHTEIRESFFFFFKCTTHWVARGSSPRLFISMSEGGNAHMRSHMQRGPCEIQRSRKETQRGKHSWLPLSLLTPAVGCNLHSNRTWQHCAELIFEVVIFNTPFLSLFTAVSCGKCIPPPCVSQKRHLCSSDVINLITEGNQSASNRAKNKKQKTKNKTKQKKQELTDVVVSHLPAASDPV